MNAQPTLMTVLLTRIAQTTKARLSVLVLMAFKETEKHVKVRTQYYKALQIVSYLPARVYSADLCKHSLKGWQNVKRPSNDKLSWPNF